MVYILNTANARYFNQQTPLAIIVEERECFGLINLEPLLYRLRAVIVPLIEFSPTIGAFAVAALGLRQSMRRLTLPASVSSAQPMKQFRFIYVDENHPVQPTRAFCQCIIQRHRLIDRSGKAVK